MNPRPILKNFPPHPLSVDPDSSDDYTSHPNLFTPYSGALPFSSSRNIPPLESPHVHFPPTPILTQMGMTHSSYSYDRHPIEVQPNSLALPQRGTRELDEPVDDGYFPLTEHLVESPLSEKSFLLEAEPGVTSMYAASTPFENIQNHSRHLIDHGNHSSLLLGSSTPSSELSGSISISIHFSRLSGQSHTQTPPSRLTRKRDLDEWHFENEKKTKACRRHSPSSICFEDESVDPDMDNNANACSPSRSSSMNGYSLGLGRVLNRTKHSMDAVINDSSSTVVHGTHFASFCDSGLEGCLGGF